MKNKGYIIALLIVGIVSILANGASLATSVILNPRLLDTPAEIIIPCLGFLLGVIGTAYSVTYIRSYMKSKKKEV